MTVHELLMQNFPVRRNTAEKQAFCAWTVERLTASGLDACIEANEGKHFNIVFGNPETAKLVFTAHYDTPANMIIPNLMIPFNTAARILYMVASICILLLPSVGFGALVSAALKSKAAGLACYALLYFGMLYLMMRGPANRSNANDNTSGVAAIIQLAESIPAEKRADCAFILFDNEEKGLKGSKSYAKAHPDVKTNKLVINMDCVGDGNHIVAITKNAARESVYFDGFQSTISGLTAPRGQVFNNGTSNSDHKSFTCGIAVMACSKIPVVGYITGRIHTRHDTVCSEENISALVNAFGIWINAI